MAVDFHHALFYLDLICLPNEIHSRIEVECNQVVLCKFSHTSQEIFNPKMFKYKIIMVFYFLLPMDLFNKCNAYHQTLFKDLIKNQVMEDFGTCALHLLNVNNLFDVTLVNVKHNHILFSKMVYGGQRPRVIINRNYLSPDLMIRNEAYAIFSNNYENLIEGLNDLTKDYYWNPNRAILIAIECIKEKDIYKIFEELHNMYAVNIVVIAKLKDKKPYTFTYNFNGRNGLQKHSCTEETRMGNINLRNHKEFLKKENNNLTILVTNYSPFMYYNNSDGKRKVIGYEDIYLNMARQFGNFNLHLKNLTNTSTELTGMVLDNFTATGPFRYIQNREADGVTGGYVLTKNRVRIFDFTYPHLSDHLIFVVPKSKPMTKWQAMFLTFTLTIWMLIFLVYLGFTVIAIKKNYFGIRRRNDRWLTFLICVGYFFGNTQKYKGRSLNKWYITFWALFTWLLGCCYQSTLSSIFTKPVHTHQVNSIGEILDQKYQMCVNKHSYAFLNLTGDPMLTEIFARRVKRELNSDCLQFVSEGGRRVMVISKTEYQETEMLYRDGSGRPTLHILSDPCSYIWRTTYMRRGHPYLEKFRWIEMQTIASGLYEKTSNDLRFMRELKFEHRSERAFQKITNYDLHGVYIIFGCGCILSLAAFLIEICVSYKSHSSFS